MPIVTVQTTREGTSPGVGRVTAEQKAATIKGLSELFRDVLGKLPESTSIFNLEADTGNWGRGGLPVLKRRRARAAAAARIAR